MPFAEYEDFDECVRKNKDKEDPKAYCAEIKRKTEKSVQPTGIFLKGRVSDTPAMDELIIKFTKGGPGSGIKGHTTAKQSLGRLVATRDKYKAELKLLQKELSIVEDAHREAKIKYSGDFSISGSTGTNDPKDKKKAAGLWNDRARVVKLIGGKSKQLKTAEGVLTKEVESKTLRDNPKLVATRDKHKAELKLLQGELSTIDDARREAQIKYSGDASIPGSTGTSNPKDKERILKLGKDRKRVVELIDRKAKQLKIAEGSLDSEHKVRKITPKEKLSERLTAKGIPKEKHHLYTDKQYQRETSIGTDALGNPLRPGDESKRAWAGMPGTRDSIARDKRKAELKKTPAIDTLIEKGGPGSGQKGHKTSDLRRHSQYTSSDYSALKKKGYTDKEIGGIWDKDKKSGKKPLHRKEIPKMDEAIKAKKISERLKSESTSKTPAIDALIANS